MDLLSIAFIWNLLLLAYQQHVLAQLVVLISSDSADVHLFVQKFFSSKNTAVHG